MKSSARTVFATISFVLITIGAAAQQKGKAPMPLPVLDTARPVKKPVWPLADKTKGTRRSDGLFTLYQDTATGGMQLYIRKDQLGKEYIYQSFALSGPTSLLLNQSIYRSNFIFRIEKSFDRIELTRVNTAFYYDPANPISRTRDIDKPEAVLTSERIAGEDSAGYLINADGIYLSERFDPVRPPVQPGAFVIGGPSFGLGNLNPFKSKYVGVKTFTGNTDVVVDLSYDNPGAPAGGGTDITDPRYVRVRLQHSFIELPKNDFRPRRDDPRVGYFIHQVNDQTSVSATPWRDIIDRWNLVKKDPAAPVSEPVEPITFWIENTTPLEYRETVRAAVLKWNDAFEKAGFRNAVRVEQMPDTASWDPSDLRYNVIRWVSSAQPPYGAIGQYTTNPRTGQILGADVTIEWYTGSAAPVVGELLTGQPSTPLRYAQADILRQAQDDNHTVRLSEAEANHTLCSLADELKAQFITGSTLVDAAGGSPKAISEMHQQFLTYLVMHETGHVFGLNHNMKGSQLWSPAEINNKELTRKWGLLGSVMDYPAINIAADPAKQGDFYTTKQGPYDDWAIQFGYTPFAESEEAEGVARILARSGDPKLAFGNDGDDMRNPGKGMDPRAQINDLSNDAIGYAATRLQLVNGLIPKLVDRYGRPGQSFAELRQRYNALQAQRQQMIGAVSRYVGGVYVDRSFPAEGAPRPRPFTPVPLDQQKRAVKVLNKYVFAPSAFSADTAILAWLQPQRRGFNQGVYGDDYKISNVVLSQQIAGALAHLLHPATLQRLTNSRLYGNKYAPADLLQDLEQGIFAADRAGAVNVFRQNLQTEYVRYLLEVVADRFSQYDAIAQAAALDAVQRIRRMEESAPSPNAETRAHRASLVYQIKKALDAK
ncbi:DUF5117 domain-containing protein [Flaviaesturariibacter flavus]|uniref:DUF5117 domain-containing protein n=1 Tax=Flaviaesturariibacter flavus TaxID=2502780 RepID=A0A4R1B9E9_9BACT|nr:zinc-dependent metalloprotease [Flaviaesturariibacter flavus]TCJ13536.1 DUF5117 domain-containing protein [Flaviaesturariibacter flavus]